MGDRLEYTQGKFPHVDPNDPPIYILKFPYSSTYSGYNQTSRLAPGI